jgi:hypothetical protein
MREESLGPDAAAAAVVICTLLLAIALVLSKVIGAWLDLAS